MKIKTATAEGEVLNWLVATAQGLDSFLTTPGKHLCVWKVCALTGEREGSASYRPSTDWAQGGPILTEARISRTIDHSGLWVAYWTDGYDDSDAGKKWMQCDRSELVAGLRCYVASKLGDEVDVPEELT